MTPHQEATLGRAMLAFTREERRKPQIHYNIGNNGNREGMNLWPVFNVLKGEMTTREIQDRCAEKLSLEAINSRLHKLQREGKVEMVGKRGGAYLWRRV